MYEELQVTFTLAICKKYNKGSFLFKLYPILQIEAFDDDQYGHDDQADQHSIDLNRMFFYMNIFHSKRSPYGDE